MDNRQLDITSEGEDHLADAIKLAWPGAPGGKATHFKIVRYEEKTTYYGTPQTTGHSTSLKETETENGTYTLVLYWHKDSNGIELPYPLTLDKAVDFIAGWLNEISYGRDPGIDGDVKKGWRVFTEQWGHVAGNPYAIVAIQPAWAMYGK